MKPTHIIRLQALLRRSIKDSSMYEIKKINYVGDGLLMLIKDKEDKLTYRVKISREKEK